MSGIYAWRHHWSVQQAVAQRQVVVVTGAMPDLDLAPRVDGADGSLLHDKGTWVYWSTEQERISPLISVRQSELEVDCFIADTEFTVTLVEKINDSGAMHTALPDWQAGVLPLWFERGELSDDEPVLVECHYLLYGYQDSDEIKLLIRESILSAAADKESGKQNVGP